MALLAVEPLRTHELDDFVDIFWTALEPLEADMIIPMIYPQGLQPDLRVRLRNRVLSGTDGDLEKYCFCVKDTTSHAIIAISQWAIELHPPETQEAADRAFDAALRAKNGLAPVHGANQDLGDAFFRASFYAEHEATEGKPYVSLKLLATLPNYHRRGAGTLLLKRGLEWADGLGLPVYLDAAVSGVALYERHGFHVVEQIPFDGTKHGGRSAGRHWAMMRPVSVAKQTSHAVS